MRTEATGTTKISGLYCCWWWCCCVVFTVPHHYTEFGLLFIAQIHFIINAFKRLHTHAAPKWNEPCEIYTLHSAHRHTATVNRLALTNLCLCKRKIFFDKYLLGRLGWRNVENVMLTTDRNCFRRRRQDCCALMRGYLIEISIIIWSTTHLSTHYVKKRSRTFDEINARNLIMSTDIRSAFSIFYRICLDRCYTWYLDTEPKPFNKGLIIISV